MKNNGMGILTDNLYRVRKVRQNRASATQMINQSVHAAEDIGRLEERLLTQGFIKLGPDCFMAPKNMKSDPLRILELYGTRTNGARIRKLFNPNKENKS